MTKTKSKSLLVPKDSPVLRQVAAPVSLKDIGSKKIGDVIAKMKKALHAEDDGVAIAAPQVGAGLRIFVVSGNALEITKKRRKADPDKTLEDLVFINPEITKSSKRKKKMEEGCLSVRWLYGQVSRHEKVTIKAYDENGKFQTVGASGLLAQIFQHEVDHLNGILFVDKAENIKNIPPDNESKRN